MRRHRSAKLLFLVICSFFLLASAVSQPKTTDDSVAKTCIPRERDALLAFKHGITSDTDGMLASWRRGQDCCQWKGVTCSNRNGHVVKLDLHGSWYDGRAYLVGQISPSLLSLEYLDYLDLSGNLLAGPNNSLPEFVGSIKNLRHLDLLNMNFSDNTVPSFLGNLSHLEYLDLSGNFWYSSNLSYFPEFICSMTNLKHLGLFDMPITGKLPSSIGNLSNLEYLDLLGTYFSGSVPPQLGNLSSLQRLSLASWSQNLYATDISWLSHLHLLEYLDMSYVNLSTVVDWANTLNTIPTLETINLIDCLLHSANQPLLHLNLTNLRQLDLSLNRFHQTVASGWFWNSTKLEELQLFGTNLYGPFPAELGRMTFLKLLDFGYNGNKAMMQVDLKDLCALEYLRLEESLASGNITELVENLPRCSYNKLQCLSLEGNNITGILPDRMNHLTGLGELSLDNNSISGAIPQGIANCTSLWWVGLSNNNLTGAIPTGIHLNGSISLDLMDYCFATLDLSNNHLTGAIPSEIWNTTCLTYLNLSNNLLTGPIQPMLWNNFPILYELDLSNNELTETIPPRIGNMSYLVYLDLSNNNLVGSIHPTAENNSPWLSYLDLSVNHLSGVIPSAIGNLTNLGTLILHSNQITGQMPPLPRSIIMLDISMNLLSGPLPHEFRAPNIKVLTLFSNNISGHIPRSICGLQNMLVLDLSNNSMEGKLPNCFPMVNIVFLLLNNNKFLGNLPPSFQSCPSLTFLDLAWNNFYGTLPQWIGDLINIQFLQLSHNMFYGDIPVSITNLRRLRHLNLASNSLSGHIPWMLSNLTAMTKNHWKKRGVNMFRWYKKRVGEFEEVIPVVMKQQELKYGAEIFEVVAIDLSHNHLTGGIPNEVTSLNRLMNLNLSWNLLSGNIPENIGDMESVVSLDLSRNNLSGQIPSSLSELTSLCKLDLSNNNLTGTIPAGRQLDTLYTDNPSMYDGNIHLCGPPLLRNCSGNNNSPENGNQKTRAKFSEAMFFYLGLGSGFTVGLWAVFCSMLFMKTWRISYFRLFDKLYEKVYVFVVVTWSRKD